MREPQEISARRLDQLKTMAEARTEMGQATELKKAIPELAAEIEYLRERGEKIVAWLQERAAYYRGESSAAITGQLRRDSHLAYHMLDGIIREIRDGLQHRGADTERQPTPGSIEKGQSEECQRLQAEKRVAIELINAEGLTGEYVHRLDAEGLLQHTVHDPAPAAPEQEGPSESEAVLHLYPLADEHGDAMVSGNREGLRILKERIEQALASTTAGGYYFDHGEGGGPERQLFAADGEGYDVTVECIHAGVHDQDWEGKPEPYYVPRRRAREPGMDV